MSNMNKENKKLTIETDKDGLYFKYRVFKEPDRDSQGNPPHTHPVNIDPPTWKSTYQNREGEVVHLVEELGEVEEFIFPLKPDTDHHARVAMAAYAASIQEEKPLLAQDLWVLLADVYDEEEKEWD